MYLPGHFEETRVDELQRVIREFPLGSLVVRGPHGLDANHIPFELDPTGADNGRLRAHVARANPLCTEAANGDEALVIFRAGDAYVSPNWYPSKHEQHRQVPTWNYRVVHVHGRLTVRDDEKYVRGVVARLTRTHESATGDAKPWKMTDSSPDYIDAMVKAIVGLEIQITRIVGKFKLSQNRDERDRVAAAEELAARGQSVLSGAMLRA